MKQSKQQTVRIEQRLCDAKGTCIDHVVKRVVKPYSHSDHYVNFKGNTVLVKQDSAGNWYGSFYG